MIKRVLSYNSKNETRHEDDEEEIEKGTNIHSYIFPYIKINTLENNNHDNEKPYAQHEHNLSNHYRFMQNNHHHRNQFMRNKHPSLPMNPFMHDQNHILDDIDRSRYKIIGLKGNLD